MTTPGSETIGRYGLLCALVASLVLVALFGARAAGAATPGGFTAPDDAAVPVLISSLRGCVASLPATDRRLLALRAGLGGRTPELTAAIAAATGRTPAATSGALVVAIRRLEAQRRRGVCKPRTAATTTKKPTPTKTSPTRPSATTTSSSDSSIGVFAVIVPALLVLAFAAGAGLEMQGRAKRRA